MSVNGPTSTRAAGAARAVLGVVSLFYLYGAGVHVANMASATGFDWGGSPLRWRLLDVIYLVVDLLVAAGLFRVWRPSVVGFFAAALSQIVLYTVGRSWILDVPQQFTRSPEEVAYLDTLVGFHLVTVVLVGGALWVLRRSGSS